MRRRILKGSSKWRRKKKEKEMTFEPKQGSCEAKGSWKVLEVVPRKTWATVP